MARTVDRNQTLEEFRSTHNDLANDVGTIAGLAGSISNDGNLVDAINELEAKTFFFQTYEYVATAGQTVFTGADANSNTLKLLSGRYQVFLNDVSAGTSKHLVEGSDYSLSNPSGSSYGGVTLGTGAAVNDVLTVYCFTGSVLGDGAGSTGGGAGQFTETAANTIYNINSDGVILNGSSTGRTVELQSGYTVQLAGATYVEENLTLAASKILSAPTITDGTATITSGVGTAFSSITSTAFVGALTGNVTGDLTGNVTGTVNSISNHPINNLSDVVISSVQDGHILSWNASNSRFENATPAATYQDEQAQDAAASMITSATHTNITVSYDDANNKLAFTANPAYADADVQAYLTGGNGLTMSGSGDFSVNTSNGIEINSDNVELDYEIVSTAPSSASGTSTGHLWFVV